MTFLKNISSTNQSDTELVLLYRQSGDLKVLGELYQRYMDLVYGVCLKYLKEPERSQDAVMQIFEELVPKLKKHEVENFRGWLHQVAKNYCLMQLRTPKNFKTVELPALLMQNEEDVHLNGVMEKEENFQKLEKCLASLPDEQRTMIKLFYLDGRCYNEIVESTGYNWNHVRSSIQNGRRNLKLCMEKKEPEVRSQ
ncbi:MAG TPA: sigma-70 family RNA polymerase sigma factor [Chitinophagaceae bacterium]|nr:sigma-70 family RNA polymerase sigma factor [Chitinophagaceae bacterium]